MRTPSLLKDNFYLFYFSSAQSSLIIGPIATNFRIWDTFFRSMVLVLHGGIAKTVLPQLRAFWNRWTLDLCFGPGNAGLWTEISAKKRGSYRLIQTVKQQYISLHLILLDCCMYDME